MPYQKLMLSLALMSAAAGCADPAVSVPEPAPSFVVTTGTTELPTVEVERIGIQFGPLDDAADLPRPGEHCMIGVELPPSSTDVAYVGTFRIPLEDVLCLQVTPAPAAEVTSEPGSL